MTFDPKLLFTPLYKKTPPKKKVVNLKPKYTGPTVVSESLRLKGIHNKIKNTKDENTRTSLVQNYYDLSTKIDRMMDKTLNPIENKHAKEPNAKPRNKLNT